MVDLLALTLTQREPEQDTGESAGFHWQWLGEGLLQCTPGLGYEKTILLSAGIHGNETAPIELIDNILKDLFAAKLMLKHRVLFVLGNPEAIRQGVRYLENDMNRMFCGAHEALAVDVETRRAAELEHITSHFFHTSDVQAKAYHYDLHTAIRASRLPLFALFPYQSHPYDAALLAQLDAADLDALVYHNSFGKTFTQFTATHFQAASTTLELGKAKAFGHNDLSEFDQIDQVLRAILSDTVLPVRHKPAIREFKVMSSIIKHSDDFQLQLAVDAPNFSTFQKGDVLAIQSGENQIVEHEQVWILFPNPQVKKGLRAGLVLEEITQHKK